MSCRGRSDQERSVSEISLIRISGQWLLKGADNALQALCIS